MVLKTGKIFGSIILLVLALVSCDTGITGNSDIGISDESYLGSLTVFEENQSGANLKVSTLNLGDDYILCADGDPLGVIPKASVVEIKVDIQEDELKNLWLIPAEKVESEEDIIIDNCSYNWIAKIYKNSPVREWDPAGDVKDSSAVVTFVPSPMGSQDWDYVIGYLDNDETFGPVAILTPQDDEGVKSDIDFGRISITWKFYRSSQHDNRDSQLVAEEKQEFILTEEDLNKKQELPMFNLVSKPTMTLTVKNMESYIIRLVLNGEIIEESMEDPKIGYSNIEGFKSRTFTGLLVDSENVLVVMGDSGELARMSFSAEKDDVLSLEYSETNGLK